MLLFLRSRGDDNLKNSIIWSNGSIHETLFTISPLPSPLQPQLVEKMGLLIFHLLLGVDGSKKLKHAVLA